MLMSLTCGVATGCRWFAFVELSEGRGEALVKCVNDFKKSLFSKVVSSFPNQLHHCCIYSSITVCHMILFCVTSFATK